MSSIAKIRRLLHLLERLQSGRTHNAEELADFCGVSRRTVFRDIKVLQDSGVRILYDAQRQGYWIPTQVFLPPAELTLGETLSLILLAQQASDPDRGIPYQETARDAAMKLHSNLPNHLSPYVSDLTAAVKVQTEPQAHVPEGKTHYLRILEAVTERRKVRLTYHSLYEQQTIRTLVSPYQLLFRRHTWYVIGRSSLHRSIRTFHLGRIEQSELTEEKFEIPPRFDLRRYLGNAWNLIRDREARATVTIRFRPLVARNVAEVAWHPTQQLNWNDDGTLDFTVDVDGIQEISWWVLGYGDQARVLAPAALQEIIRKRAAVMVAQYAAGPAEPDHG